MADMHCPICGESWDAYGVFHHEDMNEKEAALFLAGLGCPECHVGERRDVPMLGILSSACLERQAQQDRTETFLEDLYYESEGDDEMIFAALSNSA